MTIELLNKANQVLSRAEALATGELSHLREIVLGEIQAFRSELASFFETKVEEPTPAPVEPVVPVAPVEPTPATTGQLALPLES